MTDERLMIQILGGKDVGPVDVVDGRPLPWPSVEYAAREGEGLCPACVEAVCGRLRGRVAPAPGTK